MGATTARIATHQGETATRGTMQKAAGSPNMPRGVRIRGGDLEKFGHSAGCPGCEWHQDKMGPHLGHTAEFRERIEKAMADTEIGRERMNTAKI